MRIEVQVPARWERIEHIRRGIGGIARAVLGGSNAEYEMSMVAAELLENAVKYGVRDAQVGALIHEHGSRFIVEVTNVVERGAGTGHLFERIAWLQGFASPLEAYRALVIKQAGDRKAVGGLGLARIGYEANCNLEAREAAGRVTVIATQRDRDERLLL